ncbi:ABC transporter permease [Sporosarcina sp. Sa2YVA2]|uniref:ABC transporter permease n=1 Tax=Sporosarcina quadrami TaxID=2762234 RepID=A0ABR8UBI2_9BACL|nr:ABC transporter permease [Sporosarcina quadrami]MBD7985382.1 ABC transporter permease [Sporosarcina quadrami]
MSLYDVVLKNLKHNFGRYFIYIASLTFSVLIYFTFVSLQYNDQIADAFGREDKIGPVLTGASILLLVFIAIFVWYSNTFFIRNRKQEIGIYALVGATKTEIGRMLFYENMVLSLLSLGVGIGLGQVFSVFFSMMLLKIMGINLVVHFTVNVIPIVQTVIVFLLMMLLTSFQGSRIIHRFQLIDLFQAKNKVQSVVKPSSIIALLAFGLLGISYWSLLHAYDSKSWDTHFGRNFSGVIILLVAGSYMLFHSASGLFVHILQNKKGAYYKWKNLITFTQLKSRLKSNAIILTVISVLNGVTLVAFGFAYTMYYNTLQTLEDHVPFSYQFEVTGEQLNEEMSAVLTNSKNNSILFDETFEYLMISGKADDLETIPGGYYYFEQQFAAIPLATYNRLADQMDRQAISTLAEGKTIMLGRNFIGSQKEDGNVGRTISLAMNGIEKPIHVVGNKIESIFNYGVQPSVLILNDEDYKQIQEGITPILTRIVKVADQENSGPLTEQLRTIYEGSVLPELDRYEPHMDFYSFSENNEKAQSIYGLLIFVFGFLGLVFLTATGSIIYFKMLTETTEDRKRYQTLRNLGLSQRKVKKLIARQTIIQFLLPLIVGIGHSSIILSALSHVMDINFVTPVIICTIVYSLLYGGYYRITLATAIKLVNS